MSCFCCTEDYTKSRKEILCTYAKADGKQCGFSACVKCMKKYILDNGIYAQCMQCKKSFDDDFLYKNFSKSFMDTVYQRHISNVDFQSEVAQIPSVMPYVTEYRNIEVYHDEVAKKKKQLEQIQDEIIMLCTKINKLKKFDFGSLDKASKKDIKKFIKKCPVDKCKGYLNRMYKCEVCGNKICKECMEIEGKDHKCDPAKVETIKLLKKDTKPCPSCGEVTMKISGCDQMWCVTCKNTWSWRRGVITKGVIHNPHYIEYMRNIENKNSDLDRDRVFDCNAEIPSTRMWNTFVYRAVENNPCDLTYIMYRMHRQYNDFVYRLDENKRFMNDIDNKLIKQRVQYVLDDSKESDKKFKMQLSRL